MRRASSAVIASSFVTVFLSAVVGEAAPPVQLSSVNTPGSVRANDVAVVGNYAYVVTQNNSGLNPEFYVVDISNPSSPIVMGSLNVGADVSKVAVLGDYAYLATSQTTGQLVVVCVTVKSQPTIVGSYVLGRKALSVAVNGTTLYVGTVKASGSGGQELTALGIANPASPVLLGGYSVAANVNDITLNGIRAYLATSHDAKELMVLNITNPSAMVQDGLFNAPGTADARGVNYIVSGKLFMVSDDGGSQPDFYVFNAFLQPPNLQLLSSLNLASNNTEVVVHGNKAFVSTAVSAKGLTIVDVSNVMQPVVFSTYDSASLVEGLAVNGPMVYLATRHNAQELQVLDANLPLRADIQDVTNDGLITVSCLGDSNTDSSWWGGPSWCEQLDTLALPSNVVTHSHGAGGGTAIEVSWWPADAFDQLSAALASDAPDVVVLAFGTNDIRVLQASVEDIVAAYQQLKQQAEAAGALVLIALTPPVFPPEPNVEATNAQIDQLNAALKATFPISALVDFHDLMVFPEDYMTDGLHLEVKGQAKRALRVYDRLIFSY